jgi:hypothetical protein
MKRVAVLITLSAETIDQALINEASTDEVAATTLKRLIAETMTTEGCILRDVMHGEHTPEFIADLRSRYPDMSDVDLIEGMDAALMKQVAAARLGIMPGGRRREDEAAH